MCENNNTIRQADVEVTTQTETVNVSTVRDRQDGEKFVYVCRQSSRYGDMSVDSH